MGPLTTRERAVATSREFLQPFGKRLPPPLWRAHHALVRCLHEAMN